MQIRFDPDLIRRYDRSGPRYTSYPTAVQFHEGFGEKDYRRWAGESTSRPLSLYVHIPFCDTVCFYCACNKVVTKRRGKARPYLDRLFKEIALQGALFDGSRTVDQLHWGGGTPTFLSREEMEELVAVTRRHFTLREDGRGEYSIEIDPREADGSTVALLGELGFNRISLGVQDFDPRVQRAVNRIQSEEETWAVIDAARSEGFRSVSIDLMYGLPHQTVESFLVTLEKIVGMAPDRLSVFNYAHLPAMFKPQRRINEEDLPSPEEKLRILGRTTEYLAGAGYVYIGMDHFAKPEDELAVAQRQGTLYRNFQGYSTHAGCDLVGLGVTAIGMVGGSYSQNVRDLETYYRHLDADRLAVFRGIELDADDCLRREIITRLICMFALEIPQLEHDHGIVFKEYFAREMQELREMADDGLLLLRPGSIEVTPPGRFLIRNICMVFDRYLRDKTVQRFSKVI
jgi:oxygen-independent coproporphyrinogen-3 oxidase